MNNMHYYIDSSDLFITSTKNRHSTPRMPDLLHVVEPRSGSETIVLRLSVCMYLCVCPSELEITLKWHDSVNSQYIAIQLYEGRYPLREVAIEKRHSEH